MLSHKQLVKQSLIAGDVLTPMDALNRWGCFRLGARIYELRREIDPDTGKPYDIRMTPNREKRYAKYFLVSPKVRRVF